MKAGLIEIKPVYGKDDAFDFYVTCQPHVAIKLRRMFGGIQRTGTAGAFTISATPQRAYELDWFRKLHPLDIAPDSKRRWARLIRIEKQRLAAIARFDDEDYTPPEIELAIPLRDYQRAAVDMALTTGRLLLGDHIGIGKTAEAIGMLAASRKFPALVVTLTHLPIQWEAEIARFAPGLVVHRLRSGQPYEFGKKGEMVLDPETGKRTRRVFPAKPDIIIANYHKLDGWAETLADKIKVRAVIFDEGHELRHSGSDKYNAARAIARNAELRVSMTATPIFNYGAEIFAVLEVIAPDALGSWKEFLDEWCTGPAYGDAGLNANKIRVSDPQALGAYLRESGLMLRRTRKEVGRELPALTVVRHVVDADSRRIQEAATDVRELAQRVLDRIGTPLERAHAARDIDYRMRLATGIAKAPAIAEFVRLLVESDEKVLLFLWHHEVYRLVSDALSHKGSEVPFALYTGEQNDKEKRASFERFVKGDAKVLMMSNRAGAGIDGLQHVCCTVVRGELDWSPKVHEQGDGRIHRDGQKNPVCVYNLVAEDGSDPVIADVLGIKNAQARGISDPYDDEIAHLVGADEDRIRLLAEDILMRTGGLDPAPRMSGGDSHDRGVDIDDPPESAPRRLSGGSPHHRESAP